MKLMILDDHPLVVEGLQMIFKSTGIEVVGSATNIQEGLDGVVKFLPEVVLIDLRLGNESGLAFIDEVKKTSYDGKLVIFSSDANVKAFDYIQKGLVDGYVLKDAFPEELVYAIKIIEKGRKFYDPKVMEQMMKSNQQTLPSSDGITARELEIMVALAQGLNNKAIAEELFISEFTVKKHISRILSKLDLQDRTQIAIYAFKNNLVSV